MPNQQSFDAQAFIKGLTLGDQVVLGSSVLLLIFFFFPWIGVDTSAFGGISVSATENGLHGWGVLGFIVVLAVIAFALLRMPMLSDSVKLPELPAADWMIFAGAGVVELITVLLYWVEYHSSTDIGGVSFGTSQKYGWYIAIILSVATAVGGYLKQNDPQPAASTGGGSSYPPPSPTYAPPPPQPQGGYAPPPPPPPAPSPYSAPPPPSPYGAPPPPSAPSPPGSTPPQP